MKRFLLLMKRLLLLGLVALLVQAWMGRYAVVVGSPPIAYKLDRWTGKVVVITPDSRPDDQLNPVEYSVSFAE